MEIAWSEHTDDSDLCGRCYGWWYDVVKDETNGMWTPMVNHVRYPQQHTREEAKQFLENLTFDKIKAHI